MLELNAAAFFRLQLLLSLFLSVVECICIGSSFLADIESSVGSLTRFNVFK